jgi:hypothetical protein
MLNVNILNANSVTISSLTSTELISSNLISIELTSSNLVCENFTSNNVSITNLTASNLTISDYFNTPQINTTNIQFLESSLNYTNNALNYIIGNNYVLTLTNNVGINNKNPQYTLDVCGDANISGNLLVNNITSDVLFNGNLTGNGTIAGSSGFLYGPTIILQYSYADVPIGNLYSFGYAEPGNDTGYTGSQFSNGMSIQNFEQVYSTARLIIRCQDISQLYNGPIGTKTASLVVSQIRYQGGTSAIIYNSSNISTTYIDITSTFTCNTDTSKGYSTIVSPFFTLVNLDVPSIGIRVTNMTNNGTYMRFGPTYLQFK